jgi:hypothetical protein
MSRGRLGHAVDLPSWAFVFGPSIVRSFWGVWSLSLRVRFAEVERIRESGLSAGDPGSPPMFLSAPDGESGRRLGRSGR